MADGRRPIVVLVLGRSVRRRRRRDRGTRAILSRRGDQVLVGEVQMPVVRLQDAELVRTGASQAGSVLAVVEQRMELFDVLLLLLLAVVRLVVQLLFAAKVVPLQDRVRTAGRGEGAVQRRAQTSGAGVMIRCGSAGAGGGSGCRIVGRGHVQRGAMVQPWVTTVRGTGAVHVCAGWRVRTMRGDFSVGTGIFGSAELPAGVCRSLIVCGSLCCGCGVEGKCKLQTGSEYNYMQCVWWWCPMDLR